MVEEPPHSVHADRVDYDGLRRHIRGLLDDIKDPCSVAAAVPMGLNEMGIVKDVRISEDGHVEIELRLTSPFCEMISYMSNEATARVSQLAGVTRVSIRHDSGLDWNHDLIAPAAQARRQQRLSMLRKLADSADARARQAARK